MGIRINCPECKKEIIFQYLDVGDEFKCPYCDLRSVVPESGEPVKSYRLGDGFKRTDNSISESSTDVPSAGADNGVRFPVVTVLSNIIRVVAWIVFVASVIIGFVAISYQYLLAGIGFLVSGALILIVNLAFAELLLVLLAIEENTRKITT